jgi:putative hydrolase of the HAD superfamily
VSPVRALFLDAHHTLFREVPPRAEIYAEVARRHGIERRPDELDRAMRAAHEALPREINGAFRYSRPWFDRFIDESFARLDAAAPPALRAELHARFASPSTYALYPDVVPTLQALRGRLAVIGVISNWAPALPELLAALGIAGYLDFVLVSSRERCEKPDRELFDRALARAGVRPEEALHVGDHPENDWAGARAAGLKARLLARGVAAEMHPRLRPSEPALPTLLALVAEL